MRVPPPPPLQELTSKKEEEDKRKAQQLAEKLHRQRENERITKEREREERLLARQREDERQVEIQRKLAGIHPEGPSREERLQRRLKSSQAGSSSDSDGIQIEQSPNSARSSARLHAQQQQHAHHQSSPPPPSHHHLHQEEEEQHGQPQHSHQYHHHQQQREQQQHQQPARQGHSRQQAQHAQHDQADSTDQAESGLLTRLRPRSTRRRTFQETFAWSPLDVPVPQRRRTDLDLRPRKNVAGLVAAAQGLSTGFGKNRRGKWVLNDQVSLTVTTSVATSVMMEFFVDHPAVWCNCHLEIYRTAELPDGSIVNPDLGRDCYLVQFLKRLGCVFTLER